jgi:hypothetical protein
VADADVEAAGRQVVEEGELRGQADREPDAVEARRLREARLLDLRVDGGGVLGGRGREPQREPPESHGGGSMEAASGLIEDGLGPGGSR